MYIEDWIAEGTTCFKSLVGASLQKRCFIRRQSRHCKRLRGTGIFACSSIFCCFSMLADVGGALLHFRLFHYDHSIDPFQKSVEQRLWSPFLEPKACDWIRVFLAKRRRSSCFRLEPSRVHAERRHNSRVWYRRLQVRPSGAAILCG